MFICVNVASWLKLCAVPEQFSKPRPAAVCRTVAAVTELEMTPLNCIRTTRQEYERKKKFNVGLNVAFCSECDVMQKCLY